MNKLTKAIMLTAVIGASAITTFPAQAWWGGGPWDRGGWGGPWGRDSYDDWDWGPWDGNGWGDATFSISGGGRGHGRGYGRNWYRDYDYGGPWGGPYGYGAPYGGGYGAPYGGGWGGRPYGGGYDGGYGPRGDDDYDYSDRPRRSREPAPTEERPSEGKK